MVHLLIILALSITPPANGLDSLSSSVVRTKRDVMQSGQMIQYADVATDFDKIGHIS